MFSKETIRRARQANLVQYLQSKGYRLKREGRNWRVVGHGGLVVKGNSFYQFSTDIGGNSLDFCLKILGYDFRQAILELIGSPRAAVDNNQVTQEKRKLVMPVRFRNEHRVIAYLTKTRGLPASLVVELIRAGLLYQDEKGNCVFVCRDGEGRAQGAILAGTVSGVRWKGMATGSDTSFGWWWPAILSENADIVTAVESPIDAMSLAVVYPETRRGDILALGGLHKEALEGFLNRCKVRKVILALDGDVWGRKAAHEWQGRLLNLGYNVEVLDPFQAKDWNEVLKKN